LYFSSSPSLQAYPLVASDMIVAISAVDIKANLVSTNSCFEQDFQGTSYIDKILLNLI
jgi:hypothetical protein